MSSDQTSQTNNNDPAAPPKGAMMTIFSIVLVDMLGFGLIIPLLPFYARDFGARPSQVTLLFAIFSICQFISTPILGAWSDRIGRRPILFLSLVGNAFGYALLAWATHHEWTNLALGLWTLYLSRIIAGLTAGNISAAQAYISDITTTSNRTRGMGVLGAAFGLGFSVGPVIGGLAAHFIGLSAPAWIAAIAAVGAAVLCWLKLKESRVHRSTDDINYLNFARYAPLLSNKPLMKINSCWFISTVAFVAVDASIVMFLEDVFSYDTKHVSMYFLLVGVVIAITQGGLVGRLSRRYGEWTLCILGIALNGIGAVMTAGTYWWTSAWLLGIAAIIAAFGRSIFQPTIWSLATHHSDPREQGLASGFFQASGTFGRIVGPLAAGYIYEYRITYPWFVSAGVLWITSLWLFNLHRKEQRQPVEVEQVA